MEIPQETLNEWSDLTNWNCHSQVSTDIAIYFAKYNRPAFLPFVQVFSEIENEHERIGHLPFELFERRLSARKDMYGTIEKIFGADTLTSVMSCL